MAVSRMDPKKKPARAAIPFSLFTKYDARPRNLKFDLNALADFEQETGMGFAQLMKQRAAFAAARALTWAGLKHEDRSLTIDGVGQLIGQYITDEDVPRGAQTIDTLLEVVVKAAIDQGALGRPQPTTADEDDDINEAKDPVPNALASGATNSTPTTLDN